jgi:hypothetical protein
MIYEPPKRFEESIKNTIATLRYLGLRREQREDVFKQEQRLELNREIRKKGFSPLLNQKETLNSRSMTVLKRKEFLTERTDFEVHVQFGAVESPGGRRRGIQYESTDVNFEDALSPLIEVFSDNVGNAPLTEEILTDLTNASDLDFSAVECFIKYFLVGKEWDWHLSPKFDLTENAFALICIEFFFCLKTSRESYQDTFTLIEDYLREGQKKRWNIDLKNSLSPKMKSFLKEEYTTETILADFYDIIGWEFDL